MDCGFTDFLLDSDYCLLTTLFLPWAFNPMSYKDFYPHSNRSVGEIY